MEHPLRVEKSTLKSGFILKLENLSRRWETPEQPCLVINLSSHCPLFSSWMLVDILVVCNNPFVYFPPCYMSINSVSCGQWLLLQLLTSKLTVVNMKVPLHLCRTTSSWISPTDDGFCTHIASPLFLCLRHLIINKFHQRLEKGTCLRLTATDKFYISRFLSHVYVKYRTLQKVLRRPLFFYISLPRSHLLFSFF